MKHEGGVDFSGGSSLQSGLWGLRRVATAGEGAYGGISKRKEEGKGIWRWRQWGTRKTSPVILVLRQGKETNGMTVVERAVKGYRDSTTTISGVFDSGCSVEIGGEGWACYYRRRITGPFLLLHWF
ncbi:unnamed protein product [Lactuca virosa]|uniref:Uncharacterized protein n=1 Tax=Lactuca virosa TaxID=75947 RepID=A0AAU9LMH1_9ASTR|nr:unnamed protein product [Lactuca virosa]